MGWWEDLKNKYHHWKHNIDASPVEGETYKDAPRVKDLPHMTDSEGGLIAVSSGNKELSPVLSERFHISNPEGHPDDKIDDQI
ncbi:(ZYRO0C06204g) [Zygosaccharomyces parabailii]|uniref:Uncharacterized protein n=1 Tax=Zygosaccharomyces bailii (strain CLIB 213 / ATCC 58445 / CBS 680 / BCRC 21525 / NBRC 1098 / NCYC 1416 / NRRL Y-2227) TaxID=1333698 RepID=A0A8J2T8Q6_ZYGB2|nr:(ZYRO0C06204g) [Zygosaccharomyces parabailii]CDF90827.1 unnamed protein product [Zygosaccharomyces bailii CLIB 213]CDH09010.1 uncharacterized protein ZBAI_00794 [Zygosaccharomyces bailii ISA1307]SJM85447.1 uncharacterized protein ZBIST_2267 [Zygosaccharomyces bailii]AQZ14790.1 (ZYRO0C06204g) [Zygosaccharomyces parabailii]